MKRSIITTADGSRTISIADWNEQYHSKHGAIQEAYHVFIKHGLTACSRNEISILEAGFGTGLNALITLHEAEKRNLNISYTGVEAFPLKLEEVLDLDYVKSLGVPQLEEIFKLMHTCKWEEKVTLNPSFQLRKRKIDFREIRDQEHYNLIYFDAFGARVQPELWTQAVFQGMFNALKPGGILVTYSAKGSVRRAMEAVGFVVERLPGPPGKREMLRAVKKH
ncbi:tRNA (5-methylaminomethyl-2-thiouridine)(34)-methyltransferase MnmD [Muriicola soli]|uniref:SAM-dependent methyltransferase n=1 Tax=Muriicola soli TaxID=2507538 RepID=A0A411EB75_9FLAO|nr:tRNA (5-methylaminomethyl-2-thiouridine)(34)-methyltransferase MnmD [Muriicola soli]QBA64690.1 SAM-dependent methyltransferase [Muriicola soli]